MTACTVISPRPGRPRAENPVWSPPSRSPFAAVTVYILIAFSFATVYNIVLQIDFQSFRFPEWIEPGAVEVLRTEMLYFSLVTLATLGYGDILPSSPFTQMLAVLEAVIGHFFMAVLVAWLVGMFIYDSFGGER